jgi:F-type H+-transporting ATPase subunit delta
MNFKVDHRYSLALFNASIEGNCLDAIAEDAMNLIDLLKKEHELRLFIASPVLRSERKINIVETFFRPRLNSLMIDFIKLLILKNREGMLVSILKEFLLLKDSKEGILNVEITSAVKLDDEIIKKFKTKFDDYTKMNCRAVLEIDKSLIGGFTVQFKDTIVDASIKRQLEMLKTRFKEQNIL